MDEQSMLVYVGTYTNFPPKITGRGEGIYIYTLSLEDGQLKPIGITRDVDNPSFLAVDTKNHRLFTANEVSHFAGKPGGGASEFSIDPTDGTLTFINAQSTRGGGSCYISLDHESKYVLVSNYNDGNVVVFPVRKDGRLEEASDFVQHIGSSVNQYRQQSAYAHSIIMDPGNQFVLAADLGLDKIMVYRLNHQNGQLVPNEVPWVKTRPGSGPRHMTFNIAGNRLYVAHELDSTVSVFDWNGSLGTMVEIQSISMLPENFTDESWAADIHLAPSGKFLYASNRGHDSLAIFSVDPATGLLVLIGHASTQGQIPRNFAIDPTGTILLAANQQSNTIVSFYMDKETGHLTTTGAVACVPSPACVQIVHLMG
jgi:6-phosphogluconolactonase